MGSKSENRTEVNESPESIDQNESTKLSAQNDVQNQGNTPDQIDVKNQGYKYAQIDDHKKGDECTQPSKIRMCSVRIACI